MNADGATRNLLQEMIPLLVEVQRNLDQELNLEQLARQYGYSPFHFHRLFTQAVGETPKKHVERLRLEKAAYKLQITDETVLDIGLSVGFQNHETFTRAFKRHFGVAPQDLRREAKAVQAERVAQQHARVKRHDAEQRYRGDRCLLSGVRFESLRSMPLLAIRHLGDYYEIPDAFTPVDHLWNGLVAWCEANGVTYHPMPLGIFYDNPEVTPLAQQRCDACLPIEEPVAGTQSIRCLDFVGGKYGVIEHIGPYSTLAQAFGALADGILASDKFAFRDGPAIEIFRQVHIGGDALLNHTDIYLPAERKS